MEARPMTNRELIYQSLTLIEENLRSDMSVCDISQRLGFSLYYFSRLFKGVTGISPKAYMLHRKITEAVRDVLDTDKRIIDIAFAYGFGTPESFSRAFRKIVGANPSDIRKVGTADRGRLLCPITKEKIEHRRHIVKKEPELVELGPIYLVGIPFYFEMGDHDDLSSPWQRLIDNTSAIPDRVIPEKYYQVQYWFAEQDAESIFFYIALQVHSFKDIPIQFTAKVLPGQTYLKFLHKGFSNKVGLTYRYIYEEYLPDTAYKLPHLFNFEHYGDQCKGPYNEDSISEIYIPVEV
jgi:AraC family transcriptional regulator